MRFETRTDIEVLEMFTTEWYGNTIQWYHLNNDVIDDWYAALVDVANAVNLNVRDLKERIEVSNLEKVTVYRAEVGNTHPRSGVRNYQELLLVNEYGIYECLFRSTRLEARKFRQWVYHLLADLRGQIGLKPYEMFQLTEQPTQRLIEDALAIDIWYDETDDKFYTTVNAPGGDVEVVECEWGVGLPIYE